ncbi:MAG: 4Fe-4S dicluster domain-containing protein [bacterium]
MSKERIGLLLDTSRCMACRACQVACKQWNKLPAEPKETWKTRGSYENPADLSLITWTRVRFTEHELPAGGFEWLFRKVQCMQCQDATCLKVCPESRALYRNQDGVIVLDSTYCTGCGYCTQNCPFEIPRFDARERRAAKCNLCHDRIANGLIPACAKACPTQAIQFGPRDELVARARQRIQALQGKGYREASLYGEHECGGLGVMYVLKYDRSKYEGLPADPQVPLSVKLWKDWLKPVGLASVLGGLGFVVFHYVLHGPKLTEREGGD